MSAYLPTYTSALETDDDLRKQTLSHIIFVNAFGKKRARFDCLVVGLKNVREKKKVTDRKVKIFASSYHQVTMIRSVVNKKEKRNIDMVLKKRKRATNRNTEQKNT